MGKSGPSKPAQGQTADQRAFDRQLRTLYEGVLDEPIPDTLLSLLSQLKDPAAKADDDAKPQAEKTRTEKPRK